MARITDSVKDERNNSLSRSNSRNSSRRASMTGTPYDRPARRLSTHSQTQSPITKSLNSTPNSPIDKREVIPAQIALKMDAGKPPKLSRTASKIVVRSPPRFLKVVDRYDEATSTFQVIDSCIYANKNMGITEPALECDCSEDWNADTKKNWACGEHSDCINRATKMECGDDSNCGSACQNQRFQRKEWAKVTVFKTAKKGYGLRADTDLGPGDFIFEYVGEVINEQHFRRRTRLYDDEGIKHFYFMSLSKGEFVDATKKGNLGRFCNHSCNPNCYVDKWVVGDRLRMGIFAERHIKKGEELVFNYNVDRYGADPQPCYCGEPNCTGYIGGKTQTERGTKLSNATIQALGIDDYDDWEFAVAKKPRKARKTGENDEEYVNDVEPKSLEEDGVTKVMAALMQCKEKWIAVKLLGRIQRVKDERVINRVVRMHGYRILKTALSNFLGDSNVCLQVLDILSHVPRITRNKIQESQIEKVVEKLKESEDEKLKKQATDMLEIWRKLEVGYRIPRIKRDPNATVRNERPERRDARDVRERSRSRSKSPVAPSGPKSSIPQRNPGYFNGSHQPFRRAQFTNLPTGWFAAMAKDNRMYYYSSSGETTWRIPREPAMRPPPPPPLEFTYYNMLQQIIDNVTKNNTPKERSPAVPIPQPAPEVKEVKKEAKWRSLSEDKQKKLYENTLYPHIKHVIDKYKHKLPRDDIKRFAKEVSKKLASSDFKNDRVSDPNQVSPDHAKSVKKFTKEYFDKAVIKHREHEQRLRRKAAKEDAGHGIKSTTPDGNPPAKGNGMDLDDEIKLTDDEVSDDDGAVKNQRAGSTGSTSQKRKRDLDEDDMSASPTESAKRFKGDVDVPPPPPPPQRAGSAESTSQKRKRDWDEDDVSASPTESAKRFRSDADAPSPPPPPPSPPADSPEGEIGGSDNGNSEENYGTMVAGSGKNAEMALNEHSNQVESLEMMAGGQAGSEATSSV